MSPRPPIGLHQSPASFEHHFYNTRNETLIVASRTGVTSAAEGTLGPGELSFFYGAWNSLVQVTGTFTTCARFTALRRGPWCSRWDLWLLSRNGLGSQPAGARQSQNDCSGGKDFPASCFAGRRQLLFWLFTHSLNNDSFMATLFGGVHVGRHFAATNFRIDHSSTLEVCDIWFSTSCSTFRGPFDSSWKQVTSPTLTYLYGHWDRLFSNRCSTFQPNERRNNSLIFSDIRAERQQGVRRYVWTVESEG